jgi:hypothetical protein
MTPGPFLFFLISAIYSRQLLYRFLFLLVAEQQGQIPSWASTTLRLQSSFYLL